MIYRQHPYEEKLKKHRRVLHSIPELDRDLPKTKEYILSILEKTNCTLTFLCDSGVCAFFDNGKSATYAFRADMDALPGDEPDKGDYTSKHGGRIHSCGHDGHMAILLALAEYVDEMMLSKNSNLAANVLLIFQPAEETLGGAKEICESKILEKYNVTKVYGIHIWPSLEEGIISTKSGALMSQSSEINIDIYGSSSHGTAAYNGKDALFIGADLLTELYKNHSLTKGAVQHFSDDINPFPPSQPSRPEDKTIVHIGKFTAGDARNIVANHASLNGTVRAFSADNFNRTIALIEDCIKTSSSRFDCRIEFSRSEGYPAIINDDELYREAKEVSSKLDCGFKELSEPVMPADDFSFYGQVVPAVYFFLGTGRDIPLHNVNFDFDERILASGFELYKELLSC